MSPLRFALLSATVLAALAASAGGAGASVPFRPCRGVHLRVPAAPPNVGFQSVSYLGVRHLSCAVAEQAVRAGSFAITPANPIFSTPGYQCTSPIGPPRPRAVYIVCHVGGQGFRFERVD